MSGSTVRTSNASNHFKPLMQQHGSNTKDMLLKHLNYRFSIGGATGESAASGTGTVLKSTNVLEILASTANSQVPIKTVDGLKKAVVETTTASLSSFGGGQKLPPHVLGISSQFNVDKRKVLSNMDKVYENLQPAIKFGKQSLKHREGSFESPRVIQASEEDEVSSISGTEGKKGGGKRRFKTDRYTAHLNKADTFEFEATPERLQ